jgi:hypothetical protein
MLLLDNRLEVRRKTTQNGGKVNILSAEYQVQSHLHWPVEQTRTPAPAAVVTTN